MHQVEISRVEYRLNFPSIAGQEREIHWWIKNNGALEDNPYSEIIGVVADVKYEGLAAEIAPVYYESADQYSSRPMWLVVRTAGSARQWLTAAQAAIRAIDPNVPVARSSESSRRMR